MMVTIMMVTIVLKGMVDIPFQKLCKRQNKSNSLSFQSIFPIPNCQLPCLTFVLRCVAGPVSRDRGRSRAALSTSRPRYQEVPRPLTTGHLPVTSTTPLFLKGDLLVGCCSHCYRCSSRDNPGLRQYPSENEGHFVDNEPVYVPRSTMVDIIYRWLRWWFSDLALFCITLSDQGRG